LAEEYRSLKRLFFLQAEVEYQRADVDLGGIWTVKCIALQKDGLCAEPHQGLRPAKGALQRAGLSSWMLL